MPRTYKQVILGKEEDSFSKRGISSGTVTVSVGTVNTGETIFVTDISASNTQAAKLSVLNGTAYLYGPLDIPANPNPPFEHMFQTPLKCSVGTKCNAKVEGIQTGLMQINLSGYKT